jgi:uncharacterized protein YciI
MLFGRKPTWLMAALFAACGLASAQTVLPGAAPGSGYEPELAQKHGADELGMRHYVLVVLKTGPNKMPAGPERDAMFRGHFANMKRLSEEGKLVLAGPFDGVDGWRGLFVFAVKDIEEAKALASSDPVLQQQEMVAEYHRYYGSAALMLIKDLHPRLAKKSF